MKSCNCPKCGQTIHYYYERCKRHRGERNHLGCFACGAWFDVKRKILVAPFPLPQGARSNFLITHSLHLNREQTAELRGQMQELLSIAF